MFPIFDGCRSRADAPCRPAQFPPTHTMPAVDLAAATRQLQLENVEAITVPPRADLAEAVNLDDASYPFQSAFAGTKEGPMKIALLGTGFGQAHAAIYAERDAAQPQPSGAE